MRTSRENTSTTADAAGEEMTRYCAEHPGSPSAVRKPKLILRGRSVVALLGYTIQDGIAGIGNSVAAALRDFDRQYLRALRSPKERSQKRSSHVVILPARRRVRHA